MSPILLASGTNAPGPIEFHCKTLGGATCSKFSTYFSAQGGFNVGNWHLPPVGCVANFILLAFIRISWLVNLLLPASKKHQLTKKIPQRKFFGQKVVSRVEYAWPIRLKTQLQGDN